ncbi:hypothetical protein D3C76_1453430 [compost metagenome]
MLGLFLHDQLHPVHKQLALLLGRGVFVLACMSLFVLHDDLFDSIDGCISGLAEASERKSGAAHAEDGEHYNTPA